MCNHEVHNDMSSPDCKNSVHINASAHRNLTSCLRQQKFEKMDLLEVGDPELNQKCINKYIKLVNKNI